MAKKLSQTQRRFMIANFILELYQDELATKTANKEISMYMQSLISKINEPIKEWHSIHPKDDYIMPLTDAEEIKKCILKTDYHITTVVPNCRYIEYKKFDADAGKLIIKFTDNYFKLLKASKKLFD